MLHGVIKTYCSQLNSKLMDMPDNEIDDMLTNVRNILDKIEGVDTIAQHDIAR